MKALSIKQPWAWLICAGYKDIENRTWPIGRNPHHGPYQKQQADFTIHLPERVYVHAGKKGDYDSRTWESIDRCGLNLFEEWPGGMLPTEMHGAIIGEVTITACVKDSNSRWFTGPYGFVLTEPNLYGKPIPCRGQLGFFEPVAVSGAAACEGEIR